MEPNGRDIRVWLALAAVYVVWGSTYFGIAIAIRTLPPMMSSGLRFVAAALVLGAVLLVRAVPLRMRAREFAGAALVGLLLLAGGNGMVAVAEQHISSGLAALLVASTPLWLIVLRVVFRDRPHALTLVGVLVGFAGVALLSLGGDGASGSGAGITVVLLGSLSWAVGSFISPRISMPSNPFVASTVEMAVGGTALLIMGAVQGERLHLDAVSWESWAAVAYLVLFGSLVGFTSYIWLLGHAPISLVSTYAYVNPVVAVILGAAFLAEPVTAAMLVAGALIVVGVALVVSTERRGKAPTPVTEETSTAPGRAPAPRAAAEP
ncbi:drug/metabolite exporter YedA [Microbispora rosea subsp. aerata]|nr:EamA family transporter [Microbispora rosea]GGO12440.1 drug/metabolite exporter YedA [Microbispora rosea subsp. aerata]GIH54060.1 drug/metabolite exporter YedA [Microbispora rosea subsp. aerata]GLJ85033.1 drug/metabolite exporter YedA [Microbispora rosea subsp. aerata]